MGSAAHYITVNAPAQACYDWWRTLDRLPEIFEDVKSVEPMGDDSGLYRWTVSGPAGKDISWTAKIVDDAAPERLAWSTEDVDDNTIRTDGVVRFDDKGNNTTGVEISLRYDPPGGAVGEAVASLLADPQDKIEKAAEEFRTIIETR